MADLLELVARIEAYDPRQSPDNRADERELHDAVVMATGIGSLTHTFETTFVRSLDAAMTLVPEGWEIALTSEGGWRVSLINHEWTMGGHGRDAMRSKAASPALALTAASLRAHAAMEANDAA